MQVGAMAAVNPITAIAYDLKWSLQAKARIGSAVISAAVSGISAYGSK